MAFPALAVFSSRPFLFRSISHPRLVLLCQLQLLSALRILGRFLFLLMVSKRDSLNLDWNDPDQSIQVVLIIHSSVPKIEENNYCRPFLFKIYRRVSKLSLSLVGESHLQPKSQAATSICNPQSQSWVASLPHQPSGPSLLKLRRQYRTGKKSTAHTPSGEAESTGRTDGEFSAAAVEILMQASRR